MGNRPGRSTPLDGPGTRQDSVCATALGASHPQWRWRPRMVGVPSRRPIRWCRELGSGRFRAVPVVAVRQHGAGLRRRCLPVRHLGRPGRPLGAERRRSPGAAPLPGLPRHPSLRPPVDRPQGGRPPPLLRMAPAHGRHTDRPVDPPVGTPGRRPAPARAAASRARHAPAPAIARRPRRRTRPGRDRAALRQWPPGGSSAACASPTSPSTRSGRWSPSGGRG